MIERESEMRGERASPPKRGLWCERSPPPLHASRATHPERLFHQQRCLQRKSAEGESSMLQVEDCESIEPRVMRPEREREERGAGWPAEITSHLTFLLPMREGEAERTHSRGKWQQTQPREKMIALNVQWGRMFDDTPESKRRCRVRLRPAYPCM